MEHHKKRVRVVVRQWIPRKLPKQISIARVNELVKEIYPKLKKILYVGWCKRVINGKKVIVYLAATGDSGIIARKVFKTSEDFGQDIWIVS